MSVRSVSEWRKLLKLSYGQHGITIKGIKADVTELEIPEMIGNQQVVAIDAYAFRQCASLVKISLPDSVREIGCSAFWGCTNLTTVEFQNEKADIAYDAFRNCPGLADENGFVVFKDVLYGYYGSDVHIKIPEKVHEISPIAFFGCHSNSAQSVVIPETVKSISAFTFSSCKDLEYVYIPGSVTRIDETTFRGCTKLSIAAPSGSVAEEFARVNRIPFVEMPHGTTVIR